MSATGLTGQQSLAERGALASGDDAASSSRTRRAFSRWVPAAFLLAISIYVLNFVYLRPIYLHHSIDSDFECMYRPARMLIHGDGKRVYDLAIARQYDEQWKSEIVQPGQDVVTRPYTYAPFGLMFLAPFAHFSYRPAELAWYCMNVVLILALPFVLKDILRAPRLLGWALLIPALFLPVDFALVEGQWSMLLLMFFALTYSRLRRGNEGRAGFYLAMATVKPHLVLPLAFALAVQKRWRAVVAFSAMCFGLLLVGAALVGWKATLHYPLSLIGHHESAYQKVVEVPQLMTNLRGALFVLLQPRLSELSINLITVVLSLLLLAVCTYCLRKPGVEALQLSFALLVTVSILISFHGYLHEIALMVLPFYLVAAYAWERRLSLNLGILASSAAALFIIPLVNASFQRAIVELVIAMLVFSAGLVIEITSPGSALVRQGQPLRWLRAETAP